MDKLISVRLEGSERILGKVREEEIKWVEFRGSRDKEIGIVEVNNKKVIVTWDGPDEMETTGEEVVDIEDVGDFTIFVVEKNKKRRVVVRGTWLFDIELETIERVFKHGSILGFDKEGNVMRTAVISKSLLEKLNDNSGTI